MLSCAIGTKTLSSGMVAVALAVGDVIFNPKEVKVSFHVSRHDSLHDSLLEEDDRGFCEEEFGWPMEVTVGVGDVVNGYGGDTGVVGAG
jgi:hypothetical protein